MATETATLSHRCSTCNLAHGSCTGRATTGSIYQNSAPCHTTYCLIAARRTMSTSRGSRLRSQRPNFLQSLTLLSALFYAVCLIQTTAAISFSGSIGMDLSQDLIYDRSQPPLPRMMHGRRDEDHTTSSDGDTLQSRTTSSSSSVSLPNTTVTSNPLPSAFDNSLGNNFTSQTCPSFFQDFLNRDDFKACLPFSMLLKTSTSFFRASQSAVRLTQTLDATCNVNFTSCSALMSSLAKDIKMDAHCGADFALQNPMVEMAYNGFLAYQPLYHAGCMINNASGSFCYTDAVTNSSAPTGSYMYYLPLGIAMPGGTRAPCNRCTQDTMALFATFAANGSVPALSANYLSAAQQIDITCGPTFVETAVKVASSASSTKASWNLLRSASIVSILIIWLLL